MSIGTRLTYQNAIFNATGFMALFADLYDHWTVAGSIRRGASSVGDIDHVVIPKSEPLWTDTMFGRQQVAEVNSLWKRMDELVTKGAIQKAIYGADAEADPISGEGGGRTRYGPLLRGVVFHGVKHEISTASGKNLGAMIAIKTGPVDFSKHLVTKLRDGRRYRQSGGYVLYNRDDTIRAVPTEADYFALCGVPWITPEKREAFAALKNSFVPRRWS